MASIRDNILQALVTRLATISGWTVRLRAVENPEGNQPIVATVYPVSEDKAIANSDTYECTLRVGVHIVARIENTSPTTDGGNPFRYLDRLLVLVEKKIHAPDSWGLQPEFTRVEVNGHDIDVVDDPDPTSVEAFVRLTFQYRHRFDDPEVG